MSKTSHHIPEKTTNVMKSESTKQDTDWLFLGTAGTDGRRQLEILETGLNKTIIILKQPVANTQDPVKKIVYHYFTYVVSIKFTLKCKFYLQLVLIVI